MLVLATPVYCDGMTGPLKTVIDRMIPLLYGSAELREGRMRHPRRKDTAVSTLALVATCGFVERETFAPLVRHTKALAANLNCAWGGAITVPGGLRPDRIARIAAAARQAGQALVTNGSIPEHLEVAMLGHSVPAADAAAYLSRRFVGPS